MSNNINPLVVRRAIIFLLICDVILIALHGWHTFHFWHVSRYALEAYVHPFYKLLETFNLDAEGNAAVWYSSAKLLLCALVSGVFWWRDRVVEKNAWGWLLVGLIFLALSMDETASLHEQAAAALMQFSAADSLRESVLGGDSLKNSFAWVILFAPIILFIVIALIRTFWKYLGEHRSALFTAVAGVGLLIAAVALEASVFLSPDVEHWESSGFSQLYPLLTSIEEVCEVFAVSLLLIGLTLGLVKQTEVSIIPQ